MFFKSLSASHVLNMLSPHWSHTASHGVEKSLKEEGGYRCYVLISGKALVAILFAFYYKIPGFPCGTSGKESTCNAGDARDESLIPGLGRSPGVGNSNPLLCSCLENSMDRGLWRAIVHGVAKSQTWLNTHTLNSVKNQGLLQRYEFYFIHLCLFSIMLL